MRNKRNDPVDFPESWTYQTVHVEGVPLSYVTLGDGEAALLIHGYGGQSAIWRYQLHWLAQRYRVFAMDLPGHGHSGKPRIPYTPELYVRMVRGFMAALELRRCVVIGHSMGGAIAIALAREDPDRIHHLILISPVIPGFRLHSRLLRGLYPLRTSPLLMRIYCRIPSRITTRISFRYMVADKSLITSDVIAYFHTFRRTPGLHHVFTSTLEHFDRWHLYQEALPAIQQPTLILWGREDRYLSWRDGEDLSRRLPYADLAIFQNTGHLPMWERPEEVNRTIEIFLSTGPSCDRIAP